MKTVVLDPPPPEVEQLIARRAKHGLDLFDEMWEGVYHMAPAPRDAHADLDQQLAEILGPLARSADLVARGPFNLGEAHDFRVPDRGVLASAPDPGTVYVPSAVLVVEIVSPGDETFDKLPFYASRRVGEVVVVDPAERRVLIFALQGDGYRSTVASTTLAVDVADLEARLRWP